MVSLLVRMQIIDATILNSGLRQNNLYNDTIDYYGKTLQSLGYTQAQFDSSLAFYTKSPEEFDAIYDKVIIELSKIETQIIEENKIKADSTPKDSLINLWKLKSSFELPADGAQASIDFKIPTVGLGYYTISADVCLHSDDQSVNPSMVAYFYFDDQTKEGMKSVITSKSYKRMIASRNYSIRLELRNSLVTHLKGSIFSHENTGKVLLHHASITNIKIYYNPLPINKYKPRKKPLTKQDL